MNALSEIYVIQLEDPMIGIVSITIAIFISTEEWKTLT